MKDLRKYPSKIIATLVSVVLLITTMVGTVTVSAQTGCESVGRGDLDSNAIINLANRTYETAKANGKLGYVWGGRNPYLGMDCSGFVNYVYHWAWGATPKTTPATQYDAFVYPGDWGTRTGQDITGMWDVARWYSWAINRGVDFVVREAPIGNGIPADFTQRMVPGDIIIFHRNPNVYGSCDHMGIYFGTDSSGTPLMMHDALATGLTLEPLRNEMARIQAGDGNKVCDRWSAIRMVKQSEKPEFDAVVVRGQENVLVDFELDLTKLDSETNEALEGAKFKVEVSNYKNYNVDNPNEKANEFDYIGEYTSDKNGKIKVTDKLDNAIWLGEWIYDNPVQYITNYNDLKLEANRTKYASMPKSRAEAEEKAKNEIIKKSDYNAQRDAFKNATRKVRITETKAPEGYKKISEPIVLNLSVELVENHVDWPSTNENGFQVFRGIWYEDFHLKAQKTVDNTIDINANVKKVDSKGNHIEGAEFTLYKGTDKISTLTTNKESDITFEKLRKNTQYTLKETKVPTGYITPINRETTFTTGNSGTTNVTINNYQVLATKVDSAGKAIEGAELKVVEKETGKEVDKWTSTKEAHAILNMVEGTTYQLIETKAPAGFTLAKDPVEFTPVDGKDNTVTMLDKQVIFTKEDAGGKEVPGAKIQVFDKEDNLVDEWTSTTESHPISNLVEGETYRIHEEVAPEGYVYAQDITFVAGEENVQHEKLVDEVITFSKVDAGGSEVVGAKIQVLDIEGNVVDEWISATEPHKINNIKMGETYTIHEKVSANGYNYAQDFAFVAGEKDAKDAEDATDAEGEMVRHYQMIDTVLFVDKIDANHTYLKGAKLQLVHKATNEVVDEWVSGEKKINLTKEQTYQLQKGEAIKIQKTETFTKEADVEGEEADVEGAEVTTESKEVVYNIIPRQLEEQSENTSSTTQEDADNTDVGDVAENKDAPKPDENKDGNMLDNLLGNNTEEPVYKEFLMQRYDGDTYSYFEIDAYGFETSHRVSNAKALEEYAVVEVEAPVGYVKALPVDVTISDVDDLLTTVIDTKYEFTKEDITGEEVEGATIEVTDEDGNIVDKWVSTKETHSITNLEEGKKYTLKETIAPGGYTQASAIDFEVTSEGIDAHYKMVDTVHRVNKATTDGTPVKGARLAVLSEDGKTVIDSWVTGQHIIDVTDDMFKEADANGTYVLKESERAVTYSDVDIAMMKEAVDKAIAYIVPDIDYVPKDEEDKEYVDEQMDKFTAKDFIQQAFETLPYTDEELTAMIEEWTPKFEALASMNKNEVEDFRVNVAYKAVDSEVDRFNKLAVESVEATDTLYIEPNKESSGGYTLVSIKADGTVSYTDIDKYGDEGYHRVSGLTEGKKYILRELKAPADLQLAPDIPFVAESDQNITLRMTDMLKVAKMRTGTPTDTNNMFYLYGGMGGVGMLLVIGMFTLLLKKKKAPKVATDSFNISTPYDNDVFNINSSDDDDVFHI